ncbi:MAG: helix-turn-helix transcriptional regulator [Lachnospiraceae bacterium]|nr:helix-turn-helix transcriptional regulator [Lachnospiraceae bacterium]
MSNLFYKNLGTKLHACRKSQQITLQQLSGELCKSIATISKYEKGEIAVDLETLIDWCRFLNVDISSLLPGTHKEEGNTSRYHQHFIEQLYLYSYLGHKNKIHLDVIKVDNTTTSATLYLDVPDASDIYHCSFVYSGKVIYSDVSISFVFFNMAPPFDMITFSMPALSEHSQYKIGMLSSITFYYQNIAIKVLVSETPMDNRNFLLEKLQFSPDDVKRIKQFNSFIV